MFDYALTEDEISEVFLAGDAAIVRAVDSAALGVLYAAERLPPDFGSSALTQILGPARIDYTARFRVLEDRGRRPAQLSDDPAGQVDDCTRLHGVRRPVLEKASIVVVGDKTEIHGVMLAGNRQVTRRGHGADLELGVGANREEQIA